MKDSGYQRDCVIKSGRLIARKQGLKRNLAGTEQSQDVNNTAG